MTRMPDAAPFILLSASQAIPQIPVRTQIGEMIGVSSPLGYKFVDFALSFADLVGVGLVQLSVDATLDGTAWFPVPAVVTSGTPGLVLAGQWFTQFPATVGAQIVMFRVPHTALGLRLFASFDAGAGNAVAVAASRGI